MARKKKGERRANGEGTFDVLPSGKVRYRVKIGVDHNGKPIRQPFTGRTEKECREKYKEWLKNYDPEAPIETASTVGKWADHWVEVYKKDKVSWQVYKDYQSIIKNHIKYVPAEGETKINLGKLQMSETLPAHIEKFLAERSSLSDSRLNLIRTILYGIFDTGVDNGKCKTNPVKKVDKFEREQTEIEAFKKGDMLKIEQYLHIHPRGPYIALLLYTGMRESELIGLQWGDIEDGVITIRRALKRTEDGEMVLPVTKSKKIRVVPIKPELLLFIDKLPKESLYVIPRQRNRYCPEVNHHTHASFDKMYRDFFADLNAHLVEQALKTGMSREDAEKEQVQFLTMHKCRHTFATYLIRNGAGISFVKELLGHADLKTTEGYTHVNVGDLRNNISKLKFG